MIRSLKKRGTTVLLTTHRLEEAEYLADRVGILRTRLLAVDTVENLRHSLYGRKVTLRVNDRIDEIAAFLPTLSFVRDVVKRERPEALEVTLDEPDRDVPEMVRALVAQGASVRSVQDVRYSLEQMYLDLLRRTS